jgi:hypothetical protein
MFVTSTFLLLIQVLVQDIVAKSIGINNSQLLADSMTANETQIIIEESEPNLNVIVMAYSDEGAAGNEKRSHINNTFSNDSISTQFNTTQSSSSSDVQLSSSKVAISYSQLFETSSDSNVNDKLEHKWDKETNETIDTSIRNSFEHNSTSYKLDNRLKPLEDNEPETANTFRIPSTGIPSDLKNSHKSWTKLEANVELGEKPNELYKAINTSGLVNRNIASTTSSTSYTEDKHQIEYSEYSREIKPKIPNTTEGESQSQHSSGEQTTHQLIVTKTESSGDSTTSLESIDTIYSTISIFSNAPKSAYSTQLVIPAGSTLLEPLEQTTPSGIDHYVVDNTTDSMENDTTRVLSTGTHNGTTQVIQIRRYKCM